MIRVIEEFHANPRRADGRLWCGHTEADIVVDLVARVPYCGACTPPSPAAPADLWPSSAVPSARPR